MNPEFIEQPNRNAAFKAMQELREGIKDHFLSEMLSNEVYKVKSLNQLELVLVVPGHDSKQAKLINVLGSRHFRLFLWLRGHSLHPGRAFKEDGQASEVDEAQAHARA